MPHQMTPLVINLEDDSASSDDEVHSTECDPLHEITTLLQNQMSIFSGENKHTNSNNTLKTHIRQLGNEVAKVREISSEAGRQYQCEPMPNRVTVYIENLDAVIPFEKVEAMFRKCGKIYRIGIEETKAFVTYSKCNNLSKALELDGIVIMGHKLKVSLNSWGPVFDPEVARRRSIPATKAPLQNRTRMSAPN